MAVPGTATAVASASPGWAATMSLPLATSAVLAAVYAASVTIAIQAQEAAEAKVFATVPFSRDLT